jgi:hypothetical protein
MVVSAVVVIVALAMKVDAQQASLFGVEGPVCLLGELSDGKACPGCGLTRSTGLIMQGRLFEGFALNPVGMLVVLFSVLGLALGLLSFFSARASAILTTFSKRAGPIFVLVMVVAWLLDLLFWTQPNS